MKLSGQQVKIKALWSWHKVVYVFSNFLKCVHTEAAVREISDALSQTAWKPRHTEETRQDCVTNNKTKEQNFGPNKWDFCQLVKNLPEFHAEVFGIVQQSSNSRLILKWP